jgi:hypothetical protein
MHSPNSHRHLRERVYLCALLVFSSVCLARGGDAQTSETPLKDVLREAHRVKVLVNNKGVDVLAIEEEAANKKLPDRSDAEFIKGVLRSFGLSR